MDIEERFAQFARKASNALSSAYAFVVAALIVIVWFFAAAVIFQFNEVSQLLINTLTTIITFLMVFIIQNSQDRDTKAMNAKLDDLIRSTSEADDRFMKIENQSVTAIQELEEDKC